MKNERTLDVAVDVAVDFSNDVTVDVATAVSIDAAIDVAVIGAGPAGLAAALAANEAGATTLLIEREAQIGGILKQCIHDGFGLMRFGERLSGPEYAHRFASRLPGSGIIVRTLTFVTKIQAIDDGYRLTLVSRVGLEQVICKAVVFATGCRERTSRQIGIHGHHCSGVLAAGSAQYYTNILGHLPTKRCVILGSGDIGLIMARRLTLEGAQVLGVYEAKPTPSGLTRNICQCLEDFHIPLYTSKTVTKVLGQQRVSAVEISSVDEHMRPIPGTEELLECDGLILSVGLIPENELAEALNVPLDPRTKGPVVDQVGQTMVDGLFCCGNALHVNDLVDYVSESGETAGKAAASYALSKDSSRSRSRIRIPIQADDTLLYAVPQRVDLAELDQPVPLYFRTVRDRGRCTLTVCLDGKPVLQKHYACMRPPEMEKVELHLAGQTVTPQSVIILTIKEEEA